MKLKNEEISALYAPKTVYPPVVVEQTNCRISEIIRRNQAGQQVLGQKNLQFDYHGDTKNKDCYTVNPFSDIGFNLDDVILLAERKGREVTELQNRLGELKADLDKSKNVENGDGEGAGAPAPAPQPSPGAAQ